MNCWCRHLKIEQIQFRWPDDLVEKQKKNVITMVGSEIMKDITITSSKFENNGWIPNCCSGYGEDKSPDIRVSGIPDGTQSFAVIMDDLDHPVFKEFNH